MGECSFLTTALPIWLHLTPIIPFSPILIFISICNYTEVKIYFNILKYIQIYFIFNINIYIIYKNIINKIIINFILIYFNILKWLHLKYSCISLLEQTLFFLRYRHAQLFHLHVFLHTCS